MTTDQNMMREEWNKEYTASDTNNFIANPVQNKNAIADWWLSKIRERDERIKGLVEGIRFGYTPPYEGSKDEDMERMWQAKVEVLDKILTILKEN